MTDQNSPNKHLILKIVSVMLCLPILVIMILVATHPNVMRIASNKVGVLLEPDCGAGPLLQRSPINPEDVAAVVPIGNFSPPGHIIPTLHTYLVYKHNPDPVTTTIYAPSDLIITKIIKYDNGSSPIPFDSYEIQFSVCRQVSGYFIHIIKPSQKILAVFMPPYDVETTNVGQSKPDHNYGKDVWLPINASDVIGTGGGGHIYPDALDFGLSDSRFNPVLANPSRWHDDEANHVCPFDYMPQEARTQLLSKIGDFGGKPKTANSPQCGEIYEDVPGTAQGVWLSQGTKDLWTIPNQLALAHDNYDHTLGVFSLGNNLGRLDISTEYTYKFQPHKSGTINLDFNLVKPGQIYCYNVDNGAGLDDSQATILLQMTDLNTLKIGSLSTSCGTGPWKFNKYLIYVR